MGWPRCLGADDLYALAQSSEPRTGLAIARERAPGRRPSGVRRGCLGPLFVLLFLVTVIDRHEQVWKHGTPYRSEIDTYTRGTL
jgi:hypothetical protein